MPRDMLNEWLSLCLIETHTRQWVYTLEEMSSVTLHIAERTLRLERRLSAAQESLDNSLRGIEVYSELMDESEMKTRQVLTMMRERQFMLEKWSSRRQ